MRDTKQVEGTIILSDLEREGLRPFEIRRAEMVSSVDRMLAFLNTPSGQDPHVIWLWLHLISLTDYLALRPEQLSAVQQLQANGILDAGSWLVSPNLHLARGEALVRNLLLGREELRRIRFEPWGRHALITDGTTSQLPQVLSGFGIRSLISTAGIHTDANVWYSRDGSKVNYATISATITSESFGSYQRESTESQISRRRRINEWSVESTDEFAMHAVSGVGRTSRVRASSKSAVSIEDFFSALIVPSTDEQELPISRFSLYSPSSRVDLVQQDFQTTTLLSLWVEPYLVWKAVADQHFRQRSRNDQLGFDADALLSHAWALLLNNHSPSVLGGHCTDEVHSEAEVRFHRSSQLGGWLTRYVLDNLAAQVATRRLKARPGDYTVIVFNPSDSPRSEVVTVSVGPNETDFNYRSELSGKSAMQDLTSELEAHTAGDNETMRFHALDVPQRGYKAFLVDTEALSLAAPTIDNGSIIENELLTVELNQHDGTLSLFDKTTGQRFDGLNRFIDGGDNGDSYHYVPPYKDTLISIATNTPIYVERAISGVDQTLSFLQIYRIPGGLTSDGSSRLPLAAQFVPLSIATKVHLTAGSRRVDVVCAVSTSARDHCLRVVFPVGQAVDRVFVDSQFDVVSFENSAEFENGQIYRGFQSDFATVMGPDSGLTIANRGIPEVEISRLEDRHAIVLTLFRSVARTVRDRGGEFRQSDSRRTDNHLQRESERYFAFSLIPHGRDIEQAWKDARAFQTDLRAVVTDSTRTGPLPTSLSFLTADPDCFVLSSVKPASNRDGFVVRGYNYSSEEVQVELILGVEPRRARLVNLDESNSGNRAIKVTGRTVKFRAGPGQIVSILVEV